MNSPAIDVESGEVFLASIKENYVCDQFKELLTEESLKKALPIHRDESGDCYVDIDDVNMVIGEWLIDTTPTPGGEIVP